MKRLVLMLALLALSSCARSPEPIRWGVDTCDQCRMVFTDQRFGAEIVGPRVLKFDGLDEMGRYERAHHAPGARYVLDAGTGAWLPSARAVYLASARLQGPMGSHVVAFASKQTADAFARREKLTDAHFVTLETAMNQKGPEDARN